MKNKNKTLKHESTKVLVNENKFCGIMARGSRDDGTALRL